MKLVSQNCGGLSGFLTYAKTGFREHFAKYKDCDLVAIQELRVGESDAARLRPVLKIFEELGYRYHAISWAEKGNGGCITFSKTRLTVLQPPTSHRGILATHVKVNDEHFLVANCYVPNFGYGDGKAKLDFIEKSFQLFGDILGHGDVTTVLAGDFNAALSASHCKRKNKPGCFPVEISWLNKLVNDLGLSCGNVTATTTASNTASATTASNTASATSASNTASATSASNTASATAASNTASATAASNTASATAASNTASATAASNTASATAASNTASATSEFYTYYSFRGRTAGVSPDAAPLGSMRIDHVFVTNHANVETVVDNTSILRDHFPLVATITTRETPQAFETTLDCTSLKIEKDSKNSASL